MGPQPLKKLEPLRDKFSMGKALLKRKLTLQSSVSESRAFNLKGRDSRLEVKGELF